MTTTIERIDSFRRLWGVIVSGVDARVLSGSSVDRTQIECPEDGQIYRWVSRFDDTLIEHGLNRLRTKILRGEIKTADSAGRYLTGVLCAEARLKQ